jgi:hypothetical protein
MKFYSVMNSQGKFYNTLFETWVDSIEEATEYTWDFASAMVSEGEFIVDNENFDVWSIAA